MTCVSKEQALLTRPLGIVLRGRFLFVTTGERKTGGLLIEVFRKRINTQNYGHQGLDPWWPFSFSQLIVSSERILNI